MYQRIKQNPGVRQRYSDKLVAEGVLTPEEAKSLMEERWRRYENAQLGAKEIVAKQGGQLAMDPPAKEPDSVEVVATGIDQETLRRIAQAIAQVPRGFNLNPKILGLLSRRAKMVEGSVPIDWGTAEALAFGSLLIEGTPVRLSGQDTVRGTFSHRHAAFVDTQTGQEWIPLGELARDKASFQIYDSPLSEAGALGFDYGYSVASPASLVLWEAQFGDFINAAQVIVDQFIASGEEKWNQASRIVLLLPHGYEGQGPEHSSARVERFLQLCANGNLQVCNATTSAQYFHLLRRQARLEHPVPLIIVTPKSLLRLADASSNVERFTGGGFLPVIPDSSVESANVRRLLLCTGKVFFELASERNRLGDQSTAIIRLEQLYPFPAKQISGELDRFPGAEIRWVQEEPRNYGAWLWLEPRLRGLTAGARPSTYAGRPPAASTATGSHTIHQMEQKKLIEEAFADAR
jgi:2-oxoglutarate dehydrogenase E1 component